MKYTEIDKEKVEKILDELVEAYPDAGCELDYGTKFQLAVAVILSAQTTDVSVNKVTPALFLKYPDAASMASAESRELEGMLRSIGLYKNKAANLLKMSSELTEKYGGEVPGDYESLIALPGVGRKTANVILAEGFGEQRIAVDTHVFRVSNRIGLADSGDVLHTEKMLMNVIPETRWTQAHHLLIFHGRRTCKAKKPDCANCPIAKACDSHINGSVF